MNHSRTVRLVIAFAILLLPIACTQTGSQIGTSLTLCCPGNYENYTEYRLETDNVPLFLRDYVIDELQLALQEVGLERNDTLHDLRVVMRYQHINLNADQEDIDPFIRLESLNVNLNYIARLEIEMFETATNNLIWSGNISRIHQVTPGEYMHEDRARPEFLIAFRRLLEDYPGSD